MCSPQLAVAAFAGTTKGLELYGKDKAAKQAQMQSRDGFVDYAAQTADQQAEINAGASQEKSVRAQRAAREYSQLTAAMGDAGLTGNTFDRLKDQAAGSASADLANIESNRLSKMQQSVQGVSAARAKANAEIKANPRQSPLGAGLQIIGAGMNGYSSAGGKFG